MMIICEDEKEREALPATELAASYEKVGAW